MYVVRICELRLNQHFKNISRTILPNCCRNANENYLQNYVCSLHLIRNFILNGFVLPAFGHLTKKKKRKINDGIESHDSVAATCTFMYYSRP